jgi:hypothetical protein
VKAVVASGMEALTGILARLIWRFRGQTRCGVRREKCLELQVLGSNTFRVSTVIELTD